MPASISGLVPPSVADIRARGRSFVGERCTLDGAPAIIGGRQNGFATVAALPNGPSAEFAWQTVANVMENRNGAFRAHV